MTKPYTWLATILLGAFGFGLNAAVDNNYGNTEQSRSPNSLPSTVVDWDISEPPLDPPKGSGDN